MDVIGHWVQLGVGWVVLGLECVLLGWYHWALSGTGCYGGGCTGLGVAGWCWTVLVTEWLVLDNIGCWLGGTGC